MGNKTGRITEVCLLMITELTETDLINLTLHHKKEF